MDAISCGLEAPPRSKRRNANYPFGKSVKLRMKLQEHEKQTMRTLVVSVALAISFASPSIAETWPKRSQGFLTRPVQNGCVTVADYVFEGRPNVEFGISKSPHGLSFAFFSEGWSSVAEGTVLSFFMVSANSQEAVGFDSEVVPASDGLYKGFRAPLSEIQRAEIGRASYMVVQAADGTLITRIGLAGSAGALRHLDACYADVSRAEEERISREARFSDIPRDPFRGATSNDEEVAWIRQPRPTERDFPQRALDRGVSGTADVECVIGVSGRPENCRAVKVQPSGMGFDAAAVRIVQRAQADPRFEGRSATVTVPFNLD